MSNCKFFDVMSDKYTFTENGCLTLTDSGSDNLNFFALASAKRANPNEALELFIKALEENSLLAIRNLFYLRDIRGGQGERNIFRICFRWLCDNVDHSETEIVLNLLHHIPEYGRWDDLIYLYNPCVRNTVNMKIEELIGYQLYKDISAMKENKPITICAKWFPLANNTKNPLKKAVASSLCKMIFEGNERICRKTIVELRKYLDVCEQKMSNNSWKDINYPSLPAKASLKYRMAFNKHDGERYNAYLNSVERGEEKINTSTLYPYELVKKCITHNYDKTVEELWKNLPDYTNGKNAICVVDTSGSMTWDNNIPISVAISLGIYFAERNKSIFGGKFITFSECPKIRDVKGDNLAHKVESIFKSGGWGMNTNIEAVFDMILEKAVKFGLSQEDMPETIYIISDMEFDEATEKYRHSPERKKTMFECIEEKYKKSGYARPNLVFWNASSRGNNIPVREDEYGTVLVSGCSPSIFKNVVSGKTPLEYMLEILNSERYRNINLIPYSV